MHHEPFADMARKISENENNGFSGAIVAVSPSGEKIELLLLAGTADEALFWSTLKTQIDIRLAQLAQSERAIGQRGAW